MNQDRKNPFPLRRRGMFALTLLGALCTSSHADIVNGLFKGGTLAPWTTTGGATWVEDPPAGGGDGHAQLIAGSITQNGWQCGDDGPEPNRTCVLSFSYTSTLAAGANALEVTFRTTGGAGPPMVLKGTGGQKKTMTLFSPDCTLKDLTFSNVVFGGTVEVDNVTSKCVPVPEPASMAMVGMGALAFLRKRR